MDIEVLGIRRSKNSNDHIVLIGKPNQSKKTSYKNEIANLSENLTPFEISEDSHFVYLREVTGYIGENGSKKVSWFNPFIIKLNEEIQKFLIENYSWDGTNMEHT